MKKVFIVGPGISLGGIERASANTANGLNNFGYSVTYHALFPHTQFFTLNKGIQYDKPELNLNRQHLSFFKTIFRMRRSIRKLKPDVVIVFGKFYAAITALALVGIKSRFIISERSSPEYNWGFKINFFNRAAFILKMPHIVIAQTQVAADVQRLYYSRHTKVEVIPNIVKDVRLYPEIERENFILAVGRMNDHLKGFDQLIQAMAIVKTKWDLHIAGGDELEGSQLLKLAESLGIRKKIKLLGKIQDIDRLYATAGIFVIPSRSEGFPNALVEAMAAGLPCISFNFVAGPSEIITNGIDGLLVTAGDVESLANEIDNLILNKNIRELISLRALDSRGRYSEEKIISKLSQLIENEC